MTTSTHDRVADTRSPVRRRWALTGVAVLLAALAVPAAGALAAVPDSITGAITGCVRNQTGELRIIDVQAGATCVAGESSLSWPGVGGAATQYTVPGPVDLTHSANVLNTVVTGPLLPAGTWSADMSITVINGTGQEDTVRCQLATGGGTMITGTAASVLGYGILTVPGLVTFTTPDRINIRCSHDNYLPSGPLVVAHGVVVAHQVTKRL